MKVVLFCGGLGMRLREYSDSVPKPLVTIGNDPIIWHLMKYYSYFGHRDFILCLGHKGDSIKRFFLSYNEAFSNDFLLSQGGREVKLLSTDYQNWNIAFVDTGSRTSVGERLRTVREYVNGEELFLANYVDGLSDIDINRVVDHFLKSKKTACFVSVRPSQTFHVVEIDDEGRVTQINPAGARAWVNGGYFVFSSKIFDYLRPGEDLVEQPFQRLIEAGELITLKHHGFWACMDTFKEKQQLEDMWSAGTAPWQVWAQNGKH